MSIATNMTPGSGSSTTGSNFTAILETPMQGANYCIMLAHAANNYGCVLNIGTPAATASWSLWSGNKQATTSQQLVLGGKDGAGNAIGGTSVQSSLAITGLAGNGIGSKKTLITNGQDYVPTLTFFGKNNGVPELWTRRAGERAVQLDGSKSVPAGYSTYHGLWNLNIVASPTSGATITFTNGVSSKTVTIETTVSDSTSQILYSSSATTMATNITNFINTSTDPVVSGFTANNNNAGNNLTPIAFNVIGIMTTATYPTCIGSGITLAAGTGSLSGTIFGLTGSTITSTISAFAAGDLITYTNPALGFTMSQPVVGNTLNLNGTVITWIANGATPVGNQVALGTTNALSQAALAAFVAASIDPEISLVNIQGTSPTMDVFSNTGTPNNLDYLVSWTGSWLSYTTNNQQLLPVGSGTNGNYALCRNVGISIAADNNGTNNTSMEFEHLAAFQAFPTQVQMEELACNVYTPATIDLGLPWTNSIYFSGQPLNNDTISLNGVTWTFVTSGATGQQTNIQSTLRLTVAQAVSDINAFMVANPGSTINAGTTTITQSTGGRSISVSAITGGPSYTLAVPVAAGPTVFAPLYPQLTQCRDWYPFKTYQTNFIYSGQSTTHPWLVGATITGNTSGATAVILGNSSVTATGTLAYTVIGSKNFAFGETFTCTTPSSTTGTITSSSGNGNGINVFYTPVGYKNTQLSVISRRQAYRATYGSFTTSRDLIPTTPQTHAVCINQFNGNEIFQHNNGTAPIPVSGSYMGGEAANTSIQLQLVESVDGVTVVSGWQTVANNVTGGTWSGILYAPKYNGWMFVQTRKEIAGVPQAAVLTTGTRFAVGNIRLALGPSTVDFLANADESQTGNSAQPNVSQKGIPVYNSALYFQGNFSSPLSYQEHVWYASDGVNNEMWGTGDIVQGNFLSVADGCPCGLANELVDASYMTAWTNYFSTSSNGYGAGALYSKNLGGAKMIDGWPCGVRWVWIYCGANEAGITTYSVYKAAVQSLWTAIQQSLNGKYIGNFILSVTPAAYQSGWSTYQGQQISMFRQAENDVVADIADPRVVLWEQGAEVETVLSQLSGGYPQSYTLTSLPTVGTVITMTTKFSFLTAGIYSITYTVQSGDTTTTILAASLATAFNADATLAAVGLTMTSSTNILKFTLSVAPALGVHYSIQPFFLISGTGLTVTNPATTTDGFHYDIHGRWKLISRLAQALAHAGGFASWGLSGPRIQSITRNGAVLTFNIASVAGQAIVTCAQAYGNMGSVAFGNAWNGATVCTNSGGNVSTGTGFTTGCLAIASTGFDSNGNPTLTLAADPGQDVWVHYLYGMPNTLESAGTVIAGSTTGNFGSQAPDQFNGNGFGNPLYENVLPAGDPFGTGIGMPVATTKRPILTQSPTTSRAGAAA